MTRDKMNLSYSKLTCLQDCPRRFLYEYILRLDAEPSVIPYGDLGSRAHLVLEDFYKYINIETEDIEKEFNDILGKLYHKNFRGITDHKGNMATGIRNFCNREIKRFNELENKDLFIPRYSELSLECNICDYHFRGRLDAVYTNPDGSLKFLDYKFTGSNKISTQQEVQACIYVEMMEQKMGIYEDKYYFWFLRHGMGKTGKGYEKIINVTPELRLKVENIILDSIEIIEKNEFNVKSTVGDYFCCNFCSYSGVCLAERMGWDIND